jgi:hypothetical protein
MTTKLEWALHEIKLETARRLGPLALVVGTGLANALRRRGAGEVAGARIRASLELDPWGWELHPEGWEPQTCRRCGRPNLGARRVVEVDGVRWTRVEGDRWVDERGWAAKAGRGHNCCAAAGLEQRLRSSYRLRST